MPFDHSSHVDARDAIISAAGRDQSNINTHIQTCNLYITLDQTLPLLRSFELGLPKSIDYSPSHSTSDHEVLSQKRLYSITNPLPDVGRLGLVVDIAVGLIIRITSVLVDPMDRSNNCRDFELDLKLLQRTLTLIRLAIQEYDDRPLGRSLAHTITPVVQKCSTILSELLNKVNGTELHLLRTSIRGLWRPVWWSRWADDEVAPLKMKLRDTRISLSRILSALNSQVEPVLHISALLRHNSLQVLRG
jgi:hypothetical protein